MESVECTVVNADEHTVFAFDSEDTKYIFVTHQHEVSVLAGHVARLTNL